MTAEEYWTLFLQRTNRDPSERYIECFHFGMTERLANDLLALVLGGKKRATASSMAAYSLGGSRVPQVGDLSIVTDWAGRPRCVIETVSTLVLPFCDIGFDICRREGEDDCLESWQKNHRHFFTEEGRQLGYAFTEDMPVLFEDFKLVFTE